MSFENQEELRCAHRADLLDSLDEALELEIEDRTSDLVQAQGLGAINHRKKRFAPLTSKNCFVCRPSWSGFYDRKKRTGELFPRFLRRKIPQPAFWERLHNKTVSERDHRTARIRRKYGFIKARLL